ncbi:MAG: response regulator [Magnetococcales bacterium]|nr:response regulator [Magnetococcales bacterium]MBF0116147.1 response regulator [Magnetococcales bacterium]
MTAVESMTGLSPDPVPLWHKPLELQQLTACLSEGLLVLDREGRFRFVSAAAERVLGWSAEELLGEIAHYKIHCQNLAQQQVPLEECPAHKAIGDGRVYHIENDVFIHRDGHMIPVSFTVAPLREQGEIVGAVTVFNALSGQLELEQEIRQAQDIALETSRLKAEFLSNMSHELRTPIHGVIGLNDLLLDSKLTKEQRELATAVRDSAQALLTIVSDILDFSRIESGRLEIKVEEFRPAKVVEEVVGLLSPQVQGKPIHLVTQIANRIPSVLLGDVARIRQVLLNLAGNAIKFTKRGEVAIRVRLEKKSKNQILLRFLVADTGIGIAKAQQHRLFRPFVQVDGSSTRPYGGTGLGLSIASRLVELMGGQIGFESRKDRGSLFWFDVPLTRSGEVEQPLQPEELKARLAGVKILIVDPQQASQTLLLNKVLRWKMRATSVESLEELPTYLCQEAATGTPCRLVLVSMPGSGGQAREQALSAMQMVRQQDGWFGVSFILLSGGNDKKFLEEARQAGYAAILGKPVQSPRLLDVLTALLPVEQEEGETDRVPPMAGAVDPSTPTGATGDTLQRESENTRRGEPLWLPGEGTLLNRKGGGGLPILLAEDNAVIQKAVQIQLHRLGYGVHTVANGQEALSFVQNGQCALVLMDCHMPVMDGYLATQAIRQSSVLELPIIGMVAASVKGDRERCLESGMNDVLGKPVQWEALKEMLARWAPLPESV